MRALDKSSFSQRQRERETEREVVTVGWNRNFVPNNLIYFEDSISKKKTTHRIFPKDSKKIPQFPSHTPKKKKKIGLERKEINE
jgi:hypothetical protein